jgi:hypothetical protein
MDGMRSSILIATLAVVAALAAAAASAAPDVRFGIQDDAWLAAGSAAMPRLDDRIAVLDRVGAHVVRFTLRWDAIARKRPADAADPDDPAYDWSEGDALLGQLERHGIDVLLTMWGTPRWANGGHAPMWAPHRSSELASFAVAAARRYPFVHLWEVWNEPNQLGGLKPNSPSLYVRRLLNPTVDALHLVDAANRVAGGATSPRATKTALSAIAFMRGMRAAGARFDAYSHHPHPRAFGWGRMEAPLQRLPCSRWLTMANLQCLVREVRRDFGGGKRIWLTEYAYKTNPPDRSRGVSPALQARYMGDAALRAYRAPRVDLLIQFLIRDEPIVGRWASGLYTARDVLKPSFFAFALPLSESFRRGTRTTLWGQVRPRSGEQPYLLQQTDGKHWHAVGGFAWTNAAGYFTRVVHARAGARFRIWSPRDSLFSPPLTVH